MYGLYQIGKFLCASGVSAITRIDLRLQEMSVLFLSFFFPLHPLNTSIFAAHGPFTWHDGAGLQPLKEKQKAAFISELHYLTPPSRVLHHPITAVFLSASPHPLLPRLPPLGKSEEVYGACAAEEHRKGFKVLG